MKFASQFILSDTEFRFFFTLFDDQSLFALVSSSIALATALDLSNSQWIWTNELPAPAGNVPVGQRAFRRLIPTPQGVTPVLASILITADNAYGLFVNGNEIVSGAGGFSSAHFCCVPLFSPCGTLVAVTGSNLGTVPTPAGVLAAIEITYSDGSTQPIGSDAAWKALNSANIPSDYTQFSFDDAYWPQAVTEGVDGSSPWGVVALPANTSCGCSS